MGFWGARLRHMGVSPCNQGRCRDHHGFEPPARQPELDAPIVEYCKAAREGTKREGFRRRVELAEIRGDSHHHEADKNVCETALQGSVTRHSCVSGITRTVELEVAATAQEHPIALMLGERLMATPRHD